MADKNPVIGLNQLEMYDEEIKAYIGSNLNGKATYGTCSTADNVAAKVVSMEGFKLETGATVKIKFLHANAVANPTLNINNTGAKAIKMYREEGATASGNRSWYEGQVVSLTYDGTYWQINDWQYVPGVATQDTNGLMSAADKTKLDANGYITPSSFSGTDAEKLQACINQSLETGKNIVLDRIYNITGSTININKGQTGTLDKRYPTIISGGGITKNDSGFMFTSITSTTPPKPVYNTSDLYFNNVFFQSTSGAGTCVFDGNTIIRLHTEGCQFTNVDCVAKNTEDEEYSYYFQSYHFNNDTVTGGVGYAYDMHACHDMVISNLTLETRESGIICRGIGDYGMARNLNIIDCAFEGLTGTAINIKHAFNTLIQGCYLEQNKIDNIVLDESYSVNIFSTTLEGSVTSTNGNFCDTLIRCTGSQRYVTVNNCVTLNGRIINASSVNASDKITYNNCYTVLDNLGIDRLLIIKDKMEKVDSGIFKKLETYKKGSTTETYGSSYPVYAQWENDKDVKLKCDGYSSKVDKATRIETVNGSNNAYIGTYDTGEIEVSTTKKFNILGKAYLNNKPIATENGSSRVYLFIGDSYAYGDSAEPIGWCKYAKEALGLTTNVNYFYSTLSGSAFSLLHKETFSARLTDAINKMDTDTKNRITDIVVGCGGNDRFYVETADEIQSVYNGMDDFNTIAKTNFPNAKISCFVLAYGLNPAIRMNYFANIYGNYVSSKATELGWRFSDKACYYLIPSNITGDGEHPNTNGCKLQGRYVANVLNGGNMTVRTPDAELQFRGLTSNESEAYVNWCKVSIQDDMVTLRSYTRTFEITTPIASGSGEYWTNTFIKIGTWKSTSIAGHAIEPKTGINVQHSTFCIPCVVKAGSNYYSVMVDYVFLSNGDVQARLIACNDAHTNYLFLQNVSQIQTPPFTVTLPAYLLT